MLPGKNRSGAVLTWLNAVKAPLVGLALSLMAAPAGAQAKGAAAVHKAVAGLELDLLRHNLRYLARTLSETDLARRQQLRQDLVAATAKTEAELARLAARPGVVPLPATAQRLAARLRQLQEADYQRVGELGAGAPGSVEGSRAYFAAQAAAMQRSAAILDSLDWARQTQTEETRLRPDIGKQLDTWLGATRRYALLYRDYTRVMAVYLGVKQATADAFDHLNRRDLAGYEKARQQLAAATSQALAELKTGHDLDGLDITFREAARGVVAHQQSLTTGLLADLNSPLSRLDELNPTERTQWIGLLKEYDAQLKADDKALQAAGREFLHRNSPNMEGG